MIHLWAEKRQTSTAFEIGIVLPSRPGSSSLRPSMELVTDQYGRCRLAEGYRNSVEERTLDQQDASNAPYDGKDGADDCLFVGHVASSRKDGCASREEMAKSSERQRTIYIVDRRRSRLAVDDAERSESHEHESRSRRRSGRSTSWKSIYRLRDAHRESDDSGAGRE